MRALIPDYCTGNNAQLSALVKESKQVEPAKKPVKEVKRKSGRKSNGKKKSNQ